MKAAAFDAIHPPDPALIDKCVHCGFCLPSCPTYVLWGEEMDSPRGRIYLMNAGLDGRTDMTAPFVRHFDAWFEVDRLHLHHPFFAMGLRVEPANQVPAVEDRQCVVAVPAARGGRIHLDAVLEVEQRHRVELPVNASWMREWNSP